MINKKAGYFFLIFASFTFTIFLNGCKEERSVQSYIPKDASAIITLNTSNIVTKLLFQNFEGINPKILIKFTELFFFESSSRKKSPLNEIFNQPISTGLNLLDDIYLYTNDIENENQKYTGIFWKMNDSKKFDEFFTNNVSKKYSITLNKTENYNTGYFKDYGFSLGWNKELLVAIFPYNDTKPGNTLNKLNEIFELKPSESIIEDDNFNNLSDSDDDMTIFARPSQLKPLTQKFIPDAFNGGIKYFNAFINFDDDQVKINVKQYLENEAIAVYQDLLSENLHSDLCERIDDSELVAFLNFKYDKGFIAKFIKFYNMRLAMKAVIAATGVQEKELYELTGGDVFIAYATNRDNHNFLVSDSNNSERLPCFIAELKTGPKMPSFLDKMSNNGILNKQDDLYNMNEILGYDAYIKLEDDKMLVTNDSFYVLKQKRRIIPEPDREIQKLSSGYPISAYINFDRLLKQSPTFSNTSFLNDNFYEVANVLKTASFYTKPLEDNVMNSRIDIKFKDEKENSLNSLIRLFNILEKQQDKITSEL
ncbi:DUF4836 family protein [Chondrinema litorale]|uniref:DUF4836 family protein n=1 Tax=Chondrinema litorale TaxID=2994555 RepID=UPI002542C61D|nr:DUF4836 family protein [Chondrinema litorale]UZR93732.1 DUF4836 family protein [Chondrinema litorale]